MSRIVLLLLALAVATTASPTPYCGVAPGTPDALPGPPANTTKLLGVVAAFRHGDRTPANANVCWPDDTAVWSCELAQAVQASRSPAPPSADYSALFRLVPIPGKMFFAGDCLVGQLTTDGYEQHLANGAAFRAAYVDATGLLPSAFDPATIYVETDSSIRVQMSAQALVSGMYPDELGARPSAPGAPLTMIDINVRDESTEIVCPNGIACPTLNNYTIAFAQSSVAANFSKHVLDPVLDGFAAAFHEPRSDVNLNVIFDCMHAHECHHFPLPPAVPSSLWSDLNAGAITLEGLSYSFPSRTEFARVSMGPFMSEMLANLNAIIKGATPVKAFLYGMHDSCVMPLLAALDLYGNEWTPYAGVVNFELWGLDSGAVGVRIIRYGQVVTLPGCHGAEVCEWSTFVSILTPLLPQPGQCPGLPK